MAEFELLSIATIHQHVAPAVDALLAAREFVSTKPLRWVRSIDAPIRQMFCIAPLKGGVVAPQWGFSLDFVPHIAGGKVKWHRTAKSALFDAFVDGQSTELNMSYLWGVPKLLENMHSRVTAGIDLAQTLWDRGRTRDLLCDLVVELRARPISSIYTQMPIAAAMCLAHLGREAEARREAEHYIKHLSLDASAAADVRLALDNALASRVV